MRALCLLTVLFLVGCNAHPTIDHLEPQAPTPDLSAFRVIDVPAREHGYHNFKSQVINTSKQFEAFLKQVQEQSAWNERADFLKALGVAKIDFDKESLVLIRQTEGSGSIGVTFVTPKLKGNKLVCAIHRNVPDLQTCDMAYYCFALSVDKNKLQQVEVWVDKDSKPREVLQVNAQ